MAYLLVILLLPLYPLNFLLPKKRNLWLFGGGNGHHFKDNSRSLFEFVSVHERDIRAVWLTNDPNILEIVRGLGYEAHMFYSGRGIYLSLVAKLLVISTSFLDLGFFAYLLPKRAQIIQLWHGTPLKRLERMEWVYRKKVLLTMFLKYIGRDCDVLVSATEINRDIYVDNFRVHPDQIQYLGQPRNDELIHKANHSKHNKKEIWYMPTFREYEKDFDFFVRFGFDGDALGKLLEKYDVHLVVNLHNVDKKRYAKEGSSPLQETDRISIYQGEDVYGELANAAILITDYSSVYFDFLLLDRPIIFSAFDLESYRKNRDF